MSEELELQDSPQPDEELDLELEPEETSADALAEATDDVETLKQRLAVSEKKRVQLFARLKKQPEVKQPSIQKESKDSGTDPEIASSVKMMKYAWENKLSPEETALVFKYNPNPTQDTLKDPFFKAGLEAMRKASRVADATPSPSGKSSKIGGKTWAEMSKEDRAKNYENVVNGMTGRK